MGYVETAESDWLRDALIGAAPLVSGGLFVAYAGILRLGMGPSWMHLVPANFRSTVQAILATYSQPDFWLWFYLIFAVSSMMFPSASDRRTWLPVVLILGVLSGIFILAGFGPWLSAHLAEPLQIILQTATVIFFISGAVHILLLVPVWLTRLLLSRITGLSVS